MEKMFNVFAGTWHVSTFSFIYSVHVIVGVTTAYACSEKTWQVTKWMSRSHKLKTAERSSQGTKSPKIAKMWR